MTGMKAIRSGIEVISPCLFRTLRKGDAGLKLVDSRLTLPWLGFRFSLDYWVCYITSSN